MPVISPNLTSPPLKNPTGHTAGHTPRHLCPTHLRRYLKPGHILTEIPACRKETAIRLLVSLLNGGSEISDLARFTGSLMQKEARFGSAVTQGVTVPHYRDDQVLTPVVCLGFSSEGVDFDGDEPAHIIALVAWPHRHEQIYLKTVGELARLLQQEPIRDRLLTADTPNDILEILTGQSV